MWSRYCPLGIIYAQDETVTVCKCKRFSQFQHSNTQHAPTTATCKLAAATAGGDAALLVRDLTTGARGALALRAGRRGASVAGAWRSPSASPATALLHPCCCCCCCCCCCIAAFVAATVGEEAARAAAGALPGPAAFSSPPLPLAPSTTSIAARATAATAPAASASTTACAARAAAFAASFAARRAPTRRRHAPTATQCTDTSASAPRCPVSASHTSSRHRTPRGGGGGGGGGGGDDGAW